MPKQDKKWDEWHESPPVSVRLKVADRNWIEAHREEPPFKGKGYSAIVSHMVSTYIEMQSANASDENCSAGDASTANPGTPDER